MKIPAKQIVVSVAWLSILLSASLLTGASLTHSQEPSPQPSTQAAPQDGHPEFPAGPGRDTTLANCTKCHSTSNIVATGHDRQGWHEIILKMVDFGAQGSDADFAVILDYLTASFPPAAASAQVNVNTATATQIATTLALTTDESKQIVGYRDKNGKFKTLDDLKQVPKVDPKKLEARKSAITF